MYAGLLRVPSLTIGYIFLLIAVYSIFQSKKDIVFWSATIVNIILVLIGYLNYEKGIPISEAYTFFINTLAIIYIIVKSIFDKKRYSQMLLWGMIISLICIMPRWYESLIKGIFHNSTLILILELIGTLSIPICISWLLGKDFARINSNLEAELEENQKLSEEKQQILSTQNETLEKQVTERTAELNKSLTELKSTQAQLIQSEKLASLGELTAGIAHEIQNPLNFVNNFSELSVELANELKEEVEKFDIPEKDKEYVGEILSDLNSNQEKINHHGKRASSIVKGMLEHSRASTGERALTDINKLADEYLRLSFHGMRAKDKIFNADYKTDFEGNLPKIEVVPQDIGRVLLNLINNAFYAVNEKSKQNTEGGYQPSVLVSTLKKDNSIEIKVTDNGNGMPEAVKAKVFQPFFTTKPTGEGTGLGLSLAYDIVTKGHGGSLEVETIEGVGSTFILNLPIS